MGRSLPTFLKALGETLAIALLGTLLGAVLALPLSLLAARNTCCRWAAFSGRRGFDTLRGVDTLVWALVWVDVVGLGPFAGVLAIAVSDIGSLGKLFSEAIEPPTDASRGRPASGAASSTASASACCRKCCR